MGYKLENLETAARLEQRNGWQELFEFSKQWISEEPENFFAWQAMGDALRKLNSPAEAVLAFRRGLELMPPHPIDLVGIPVSAGPLWYKLGHAYSEMGNVELSIEAFKEAARIDPEVVDIWNDLGVIYADSKDYKSAFEAFKKAVVVDPTNINSLKNLGIVYAMYGVEEGVNRVHLMLSGLNTEAAKEFLAKSKQILSNH